MRKLFIGTMALSLTLAAQTTSTTTERSVTATGNATVSATPDKAALDLGVTTQASTAQAASTQNATQVSSVIASLQGILGATASIKTVSYSLTPVYSNYNVGQNPTIIGYAATNIVEATITDLTLIGKCIDASIAAGANNVNGITFGLQNPDPVTAQALKAAAASALNQATAIASGLNVTLGGVLQASQVVTYTPLYVGVANAPAAASTPVQPGNLQIGASVTVQVAISQ